MFPKKRIKFSERTGNLVTIFRPYSPIAEEFRSIRSNIQFQTIDQSFSSLMVTSAAPGEGKSTMAANIAAVFAAQGKKVLLIDADLRNPSLHFFFNCSNREGLTTLLSEDPDSTDGLIHRTYQRNLFFLPTGTLPPNPSELLSSSKMDDWMVLLEAEFDLVIYDLPPIVTVTDAQIMAGKTDGTIFVVRNNVTDRKTMMKAKQLLELAQANVIGVLFNGKKKERKNQDVYGYYGSAGGVR